jgi:hypothetical protein
MTQETVPKPAVDLPLQEPKRVEKKQVNVQEIVDSLKAAADDIGQISELTNEEKLLIAQFFESLLKLMKPLTPAIPVSTSALPFTIVNVVNAHVDPTGHLALTFEDGHLELKNLSEDKNRDLMMAVVGDVMPKFKGLTSVAKRKVENRIKFLTSVTKEMQKSSDALSAVMSASEK